MDKVDRIKNQQEWIEFISSGAPELSKLRQMRLACYNEIVALRGRPLLVYAVKLNPPDGAQNTIDISDIEGFSDLIEANGSSNEIDILIHSPGGSIDATERIVQILRSKFEKVHFLVPHSAYSAATMLCLSGNSIVLHPNATLGPIDPQINGVPARLLKNGFENIKEKIKYEGPASLPAYVPLIQKFSIELLEFCDDTERLAKILVRDWLQEFMFDKETAKIDLIENAVDFFSNYDTHLTHSRPLNYKTIKDLGLAVSEAPSDLAGLLWEAYINISNFLAATTFVKLFEDTTNISWGRQLSQQFTPSEPDQT